MGRIILDISSEDTLSDITRATETINSVIDMDTHKHEVIFKVRLSQDNQLTTFIDGGIFDSLYLYAKVKGYRLTASVCDKQSLMFLLMYDIPFVRIPNRFELYELIKEVPRKIPVYVSNIGMSSFDEYAGNIESMACISKYPATLADYESIPNLRAFWAISDHTPGLELYRKYQPRIWEKHYTLEHDVGSFSLTPSELREII